MRRFRSIVLGVVLCFLLIPVLTLYKAEAANGDVAINSTNFPDSNFLEYVSTNFDQNRDGILSISEISEVQEINVPQSNITTLKGIE